MQYGWSENVHWTSLGQEAKHAQWVT